ncbi:MAG: ABC transporter permease subunit [Gemmatimonadetes bacterium]|nr:ABC transporter permease subunit [Gemmatimonadota bacterium]
MTRGALVALAALLATAPVHAERPLVRVGSKKFTESVILGEVLARTAHDAGAEVEHRRELGGTRVVWNALRRGDLDAYCEYTGTLRQEILAGRAVAPGDSALAAALAEDGVELAAVLGFENTYAIGVLPSLADSLGLRTISDLARHPMLSFAFTNEFLDRGDGWPSLRDAYGLPQRDVSGVDHDLAYRGLASGAVHAIDLYSTDAEIRYYGLRILEDDRHHFPEYRAVVLVRSDLRDRAPAVVRAFRGLAGAIDDSTMVALNASVKLDRESEAAAAAGFLHPGEVFRSEGETPTSRFLRNLRDHLLLVGISLSAAIVVAVPLGVVAAKRRRLGQWILGGVGVLQTIPSLALLVLMIPWLGIGAKPAIAALFLYGLLPIVRNTTAGLTGIDPGVLESARSLALGDRFRLFHVELPLAAPSILAGIKTSAVINVGTATLGALIGAGGFGQPILTGIRLDDVALILQGALPAAGLALAVQGLFEVAERVLVPAGLRA